MPPSEGSLGHCRGTFGALGAALAGAGFGPESVRRLFSRGAGVGSWATGRAAGRGAAGRGSLPRVGGGVVCLYVFFAMLTHQKANLWEVVGGSATAQGGKAPAKPAPHAW